MNPYPIFTLGEVIEISNERIAPLASPQIAFNYVGLEHIESNTGQLLARPRTLGSDIKSTKNSFKPNEILYGKLRPYLNKVHLAKTHGVCSTDIFVLRPRSNVVSPAYVAYCLRSQNIVTQATNAMTGANLPRISQSAFQALPIPVPPLADQDRIVALLDEVDALRKLRAQADQRTADLIPALFHHMFGDPATNPMGWPLFPISSFVANFVGGKSINPAAESIAGGWRVLKISAVTSGFYKASECKPLPIDYVPPESHMVKRGDLLFSRANTTDLVGASCYVFETPENLLLPDKLWKVHWKESQSVEPLFFLSLLQYPSIRRKLGRLATGTGGSMKNISKSKLMSLSVPVPPVQFQKHFVEMVELCRRIGCQQQTNGIQTVALFNALLAFSFNGNF